MTKQIWNKLNNKYLYLYRLFVDEHGAPIVTILEDEESRKYLTYTFCFFNKFDSISRIAIEVTKEEITKYLRNKITLKKLLETGNPIYTITEKDEIEEDITEIVDSSYLDDIDFENYGGYFVDAKLKEIYS